MRDGIASKVSFKTRYLLTPVDKDTLEPTGNTVEVCNLVLDSGLTALGTGIAYTDIAIGSSRLSADPVQTGLIKEISSVTISPLNTTHSNEAMLSGVLTTVTHDVLFMNIKFPASEKELSINEVGLVGMTRAVLEEPLVITAKDWVSVKAIIEYSYFNVLDGVLPLTINGELSDTEIHYTVEAHPLEHTVETVGKGFGGNNTILFKVWDGTIVSEEASPYLVDGLVTTTKLERDNHRWVYTLKGDYKAMAKVPGITIQDTVNGVLSVIAFTEALSFQEDDQVVLTFNFEWSR